MDTNVNAGLLAMRAANARRAEERKLKGLSVKADAPSGGSPRKAAAVSTKTKLPNRVWRVTLAVEHEGVKQAWACPDVNAPTIKRAVKQARGMWRDLHKGEGEITAVAGVFDRDLSALPARPV